MSRHVSAVIGEDGIRVRLRVPAAGSLKKAGSGEEQFASVTL